MAESNSLKPGDTVAHPLWPNGFRARVAEVYTKQTSTGAKVLCRLDRPVLRVVTSGNPAENAPISTSIWPEKKLVWIRSD